MFQQGNDFEDSDYYYQHQTDMPVSFENGAIMFEQNEFIRQHLRDMIVKYNIKHFEEYDFQQIIQHFTSYKYKTKTRYEDPKYDYNDIHNFLLDYIRKDEQNQKYYVRIMMEIWKNQAQLYSLSQKQIKLFAKEYYTKHQARNKVFKEIEEKMLQEYFLSKLKTEEQIDKFRMHFNLQQE